MLNVGKVTSFTFVAAILFAIFLSVSLNAPKINANSQYSECRELAENILEINNSKFSFGKCAREDFLTESGEVLTRVEVTAGKYKTGWEFECGYMSACTNYIGWFDELNKPLDIPMPPETANQDPAVYSIGCGRPNVESVHNTKVDPLLVRVDGKYGWKIEYKDTVTNETSSSGVQNKQRLCVLNGESIIFDDEVVSSVRASYDALAMTCSENPKGSCGTHESIESKSADACMVSGEIKSGLSNLYNYDCLRNYVIQTRDLSQCNAITNIGAPLDCESLPIMRKVQ